MEFKSIKEKVAYLKGLMEGLDRDDKVIALIADILGDMAEELEDVQCDIGEMAEVVDEIDEDLGELEEDFCELCDCCDDDDDDDFDDEDDGDMDELDFDEDDEELFDDEELYEVTCPSCSDTICLNEAMLDEGSINCPNCGELLEFDTEDIGGEDEE